MVFFCKYKALLGGRLYLLLCIFVSIRVPAPNQTFAAFSPCISSTRSPTEVLAWPGAAKLLSVHYLLLLM